MKITVCGEENFRLVNKSFLDFRRLTVNANVLFTLWSNHNCIARKFYCCNKNYNICNNEPIVLGVLVWYDPREKKPVKSMSIWRRFIRKSFWFDVGTVSTRSRFLSGRDPCWPSCLPHFYLNACQTEITTSAATFSAEAPSRVPTAEPSCKYDPAHEIWIWLAPHNRLSLVGNSGRKRF